MPSGLQVLGRARGDVLGVGGVVVDECDRLAALGLDELAGPGGLLDAGAVDEEDVRELLPLTRSAELAAGMSIGMSALSKMREGRQRGRGAVAAHGDVDLAETSLAAPAAAVLGSQASSSTVEREFAAVDATGGVDLVDGQGGRRSSCTARSPRSCR
jgi:hypothetical protein